MKLDPGDEDDEGVPQEVEVSLTTLRMWEVFSWLQCALMAVITQKWEGIDDEGSASLEAVHFHCSLVD